MEVVDAEIVEEAGQPQTDATGPGTALEVHRPQGSTALIEARTAGEKREIAAEIATTLDDVIKQQGLRTKMGQRKQVDANGNESWVDSYHVNVEGWQTLATFLDLAVVPVWTREVVDQTTGQPRRVRYPVTKTTRRDGGKTQIVEEYEVDGYDWEARVEVYKDGALLAAAEAMVTRSEHTWKTRDDHALRSMAQTRATGKAIAGAARWIVALAGYSATPAEEMPGNGGDQAPAGDPYGPKVENGMRTLVFQSLQFLVELDDEPAAAAGLPASVEVAKAVAADVAKEAGYMPLIVGKALLAIANARQARRSAALEASAAPAAAPAPETVQVQQRPDGATEFRVPTGGATASHAEQPAQALPAVQQVREGWPAGTVFIEGEDILGVPADSARVVTAAAAKEICTCAGGFDAVEALDARQRGAASGVDDTCPLRNHGIPF